MICRQIEAVHLLKKSVAIRCQKHANESVKLYHEGTLGASAIKCW